MKPVWRMIIGAVLFAIALVASSWLLKDNPAGDWVDAFLYVALGAFLLSQAYFLTRSAPK